MAKKKKLNLPPEGAAFAFDIGDGRYSVCRILLDGTSQRAAERKNGAVLAACSRLISNDVPRSDDPAVREILRCTHHSWKNQFNVRWVTEEIPADFIPIGRIALTSEEKELPCNSIGYWDSLTVHPLMQWRWDHDRQAVLAEDAAKRAADSELLNAAKRERENQLAEVTLEQLRGRRFFPKWRHYTPRKMVVASRLVMAETVESLILLGSAATVEQKLAVLQKCIERFNALDAQTAFIETEEREAICSEFETLVYACGLGSHVDLADRWREW